jgi:hypothetical protein
VWQLTNDICTLPRSCLMMRLLDLFMALASIETMRWSSA